MKNSEEVRLWVSSTGDPQCRYAPFPAPTTALLSLLALIPAKLFLPPLSFWLAHLSTILSIPLKITHTDKVLLFSAKSAILAHSHGVRN